MVSCLQRKEDYEEAGFNTKLQFFLCPEIQRPNSLLWGALHLMTEYVIPKGTEEKKNPSVLSYAACRKFSLTLGSNGFKHGLLLYNLGDNVASYMNRHLGMGSTVPKKPKYPLASQFADRFRGVLPEFLMTDQSRKSPEKLSYPSHFIRKEWFTVSKHNGGKNCNHNPDFLAPPIFCFQHIKGLRLLQKSTKNRCELGCSGSSDSKEGTL